MIISQDTEKVIGSLSEFSENNLRKPNDLAVILEIGATYGINQQITDLIFFGTSIIHLHKTLKHINNSDKSYHLVLNELNYSISEITKLLTEIAELFENQVLINRFHNIYLQGSSGTLMNIIDLSNDLYYLKKLQQSSKSNRSNAHS